MNKNSKYKIQNSHSRFFFLNSQFLRQNGFTLVEMTVVMAIIAMFSLAVILSVYSSGSVTRLENAAKVFQSTIREAANNAITVETIMNPLLTAPAKAWSIKVTNGPNDGFSLECYYKNLSSQIVKCPSDKKIQYEGIIQLQSENNSDDIHLIFSSPFARFTAVEKSGGLTDWVVDTDKAKEVYPGTTLAPITNNLIFYIQDNKNKIPVEVNFQTGEASIMPMEPR